MEKAFVYGMSVGGNNFTDRIEETKRIKLDFENGINVILISPRRMGKTSLIKKVISEIDNPMLKIVYMDIYDCRSEYDFYNRFAETIMKSTGNHLEQVMENIKRFLVRISPKLSADRGVPRFAEYTKTTAWCLAAPSECVLLFLWQQEASDGEHFPKSSHAFLSVWRNATSQVHSYGILGPLHLFSIREVRQEDNRRVCRQNMQRGEKLLILCAATCMERDG